MARERTNFDRVAFLGYAGETVDPVDIDEEGWRGEPHIQRGDQALPTRQKPRILFAEQRNCLVERARLFVSKWRRFHMSSPWDWRVILPEDRVPLFGITRWLFSYCDRERHQVNACWALAMRLHAAYKGPHKIREGPVPKEFEGKVVVVTGGSRGIGRAIAVAFAREGAQTVLAAANEANLAEGAEAVAAAGGPEAMTIAGDLRTLDACEQVFEKVERRFKRCDVLVNNAGATRGGNFFELPDTAWTDGFALKFFATVRLTKLFWPLLKASHGSIVNIIGGAARTPGPDFLIGGAVNAAMGNFAKGLTALGNRDDVNVNVIHPGQTQTDRVEQLFQQFAKAQNKTVDQVRAESLAKSGLRRIGTPEDIAALAVFLCGASARHIHGTAIAVDGGGTPGYY